MDNLSEEDITPGSTIYCIRSYNIRNVFAFIRGVAEGYVSVQYGCNGPLYWTSIKNIIEGVTVDGEEFVKFEAVRFETLH